MIRPDTIAPSEDALHLDMIPLRKVRGSWRWAIYSRVNGRAKSLWGPYTPPVMTDAARRRSSGATWPGMVYHPRSATGPDDLPAWHFALDFGPASWGVRGELRAFARALAARVGRPVSISILHGWAPITETSEGAE